MKELILNDYNTALQADELSRAVYNCSMTGRKLIAFATAQLYAEEEEDKSGNKHVYPTAKFKITDFLTALNLPKSGEAYELTKKTVQELRHCSVEIKKNDDEFRIWNWFSYIEYSKTKDQIELHFSSEIGWALMDLKNSYCALDLPTVGGFKSFYAFRFYEIALSWMGMKGRNGNPKGTWWFQMTPDEIRKTFKIDDKAYSGRMNNFIKYVIQNPLDELNSICNEFKIEVLKIKRGRNLVAFRFDCTELKQEAKKIAKSDSAAIRQDKREINNERAEIQHFKTKFPEDWEKALADAKSQRELPMGLPRLEINDEFEAVKIMKKWGLK